MSNELGLVIGGEVVKGDDGTYPVTNPARPSEVVLDAPAVSSDQLDTAVSAARNALANWSGLSIEERSALVRSAAKNASARVDQDDLAKLLTKEHGKVLWEAAFDTGTISAMADAFSPMARDALSPRVLGDVGRGTEVEWVPQGVVAALLPFNWPVSIMANKVLPALLAGNTVVVKAPPTCPGAVLAATVALSEVLPPGTVNIVNGPDASIGANLVSHPDVDMVSFTGGVATGRAVMTSAAQRTKPVVLELGGNDAAIIAPDVEIDSTLAGAIFDAAFVTSGQVCMAIKRLYVHEDRLGELLDAMVERISGEVVGDGLVEGVTMGPMHTAAGRDRVEEMIDEAHTRGARTLQPGSIRDDDLGAGGYFVSPTLVVSPPSDSRIVVEEQFGPALPILSYSSIDGAVEAANVSSFGLCASIWSRDADLAADVARRLNAGTVFINAHGMSAMDYRAPMGGWKDSGFGLELGPEGMREFTRPRVILSHQLPGS